MTLERKDFWQGINVNEQKQEINACKTHPNQDRKGEKPIYITSEMPDSMMNMNLRLLLAGDSEEDALQVKALLQEAGHELTFRRVGAVEEIKHAIAENAWDVIIV